MLLVGRDFHARAGDHVVERAARQLAVVRHRRDVEQHMALRRIGKALRDQRLHDRDHLRHILGRARFGGGPHRVQGAHVIVIELGGARCQVGDALAVRLRRVHDLVFDVGDVAHIGDVRRAISMAQQPEQRVKHHHRPRVADMRIVVDGRAADIHAHVLGIDRRERLLLARKGVVEVDGHDARPRIR
jgi:hypothetical protein